MTALLRYIKARLGERSTYASFAAAMVAGAALEAPWSYGAALAAFMTSFIPEKPKGDGE